VWTPTDDAPAKPDAWKANPCGCRACNICGFYGLAAKPPPPPLPTPASPAPTPERGPVPRTPTLFDEVPA